MGGGDASLGPGREGVPLGSAAPLGCAGSQARCLAPAGVRAHLGSLLPAPGLVLHQLQLPRGPGQLLPQLAGLRFSQRQGLGDRGGVLVRGLGGSEERLSRILGATALPGCRLWEEEPLRGSCIPRGWVQPASLRSGSSPTPPRVPFPSHLHLPNTCSLPAQVRGLHGPPPPWSPPPAPGTEQEPLIVPNLPTCSASLRGRGAREPPEMLHFAHQPRGGRDPCSVIRLWGGRDLAMPVSHKCTSSPCQAHWGGQPGDMHDLRSGSPMSIYNGNKTPTEGRPTERRGIPAHVRASCSCGKEPASSEHRVESPQICWS